MNPVLKCQAEVLRSSAKQSFADMRDQAGAWSRGRQGMKTGWHWAGWPRDLAWVPCRRLCVDMLLSQTRRIPFFPRFTPRDARRLTLPRDVSMAPNAVHDMRCWMSYLPFWSCSPGATGGRPGPPVWSRAETPSNGKTWPSNGAASAGRQSAVSPAAALKNGPWLACRPE